MKVCGVARFGTRCSRSFEDGVGDGDGGGSGKDTPIEDEFSKLPTVPIVGALVKADVLSRAKQKREEMAAQIVKTRIALWEATIEGGVLAGLVKQYSTG